MAAAMTTLDGRTLVVTALELSTAIDGVTSVRLDAVAHCGGKAASKTLRGLAERGLIECVGGHGVHGDPFAYRITTPGIGRVANAPTGERVTLGKTPTRRARLDFGPLLRAWPWTNGTEPE